MKRILITGGAGFIGSHIVDALLAQGDYQIAVIDNFATGRRENLQTHASLQVCEGDLSDGAFVAKVFADFQPQVVIHAAASYKDPEAWSGDVHTNTLGAAHVVQEAKKQNVSRIIYFQTALCYGLKPKVQPVPVDAPLEPWNSSYAITKTAAEQFIQMSGIDYISLRLANIIGSRNLSGPVVAFYQRLRQGKSCFVMDTRRDFVFVEDLVKLVVKAVRGKGTSGVYHVSSGTDWPILTIFQTVVETLGIQLERPVDIRQPSADDAPSILLDPSKTYRDFEWKTTTPFQDAVRRAVEWYETHGVEQTFTHLKPAAAKS